MKKATKLSLVLAAALAFGCAAVACDDNPDDKKPPQEPAKYTVTYEIGTGATGTAPESVEKAKGEKFDLPEYDAATATFSKEGWTFDGWHDGKTKYDGGAEYTMPGSKVTFTAQWVVNEYTVTFDLDYGGAPKIDSQTVEHGNKATAPDNVPSRGEHVTFEGWCVGSADGDAFNFDTPITSNVDLVANWTIENGYYSVTYSAPDGATGTGPAEEVVAIGTMVKLPANPFTKTGWTFYGWKNLNAGENEAVYYNEEDEFAFNTNREFRAVFQSKKYVGEDEYGYETSIVLHDDGNLAIDFGYGENITSYETLPSGYIYLEDYDYIYKLDDADSSLALYDGFGEIAKTAKNGAVLTLDGFGGAKLGDHVGTYVVEGYSDRVLTLTFGDVVVEDILVLGNIDPEVILNCTITIDGTDYVFEHIVEYPTKFVGKYTGTSYNDKEYVVEITDTKVTLAIDGEESEAFVLSYDIEEDPLETIETLSVLIDGETWIITDISEKDGLVETIRVWKDRWNNAECTRYVAPDPNATYTVTVVKSTDEKAASVVGEIPAIDAKKAGDTFTIPADTFSLAHYHQTLWLVQKYVVNQYGEYWDTIESYALDEEITMPDCNVRIAAFWMGNNVTISFDANGGSGTMSDITKGFGTNLALTTSAFNCGFTAPDGKEFKGWALTKANADAGTVIANGTKLDATIVSAQDTITLYAVWDEAVSTALNIQTIVGHWTTADNAHTFDVVTDTFGNNYVQGGGVLDGEYAVFVMLSEEDGNAIFDIGNTGRAIYALSYADSTLTLTPGEGAPIVLTNKTALTSSAATAFDGKYSKPLTSGSQPWVIAGGKAYYNASAAQAQSVIVGSKIVLSYYIDFTETYEVYVLGKDADSGKLVGKYIPSDDEKPSANIEFAVGDFYTLTVNGKLNQIVNNGATVDASKLPTSDDDGAITGWVIAGTETAFDPATATIAADTAITAVHASDEDALTGSAQIGTTVTMTIAKFAFTDATTITAYDNAGNTYAVTLGSEKPSWAPTLAGYGTDNAKYYATCYINSIECGLYIKNDLSAIWVCDKDDNAISSGEFN